MTAPIAIYHEHPDWFRPLFAELDRRGLAYVRLDAAAHRYDPHEAQVPWALVFNRASPSAYRRGHAQATFHTLHWLRHLERLRVPVVNGAGAYALELSKANQLDLLHELRLRTPATRVANAATQVIAAAHELRFPLLVKANIGGSGAGIVRYDTADALHHAATTGALPASLDATWLVQELVPARDAHITRVETLNGRYLYAIDVYPPGDSFDLCPADACQTASGLALTRTACAADAARNGLRVAAATPPAAIIKAAERIARAAQLDVGGIEYLIDDRDGEACFYDINALSNFVADALRVIGFDPHARLVDYLENRLPRAARRHAALAERA